MGNKLISVQSRNAGVPGSIVCRGTSLLRRQYCDNTCPVFLNYAEPQEKLQPFDYYLLKNTGKMLA